MKLALDTNGIDDQNYYEIRESTGFKNVSLAVSYRVFVPFDAMLKFLRFQRIFLPQKRPVSLSDTQRVEILLN